MGACESSEYAVPIPLTCDAFGLAKTAFSRIYLSSSCRALCDDRQRPDKHSGQASQMYLVSPVLQALFALHSSLLAMQHEKPDQNTHSYYAGISQ